MIACVVPFSRAVELVNVTMSKIFRDWQSEDAQVWGRVPLCASHSLHQSPLFERDTLSALIDAYPREHYSIIKMGAQGGKERYWHEGEVAALSGAEILAAVEAGRFWLNLRCTDQVDPRYRTVLDQMFAEVERNTGQSDCRHRSLGILVSSPNAQVYYHCDLPNQSLWQISGRKTVWVYPPVEPFLSGEDLEKISVFELEVDMTYHEWFDRHAQRFDLEPGQMLHWPLNAPHRITNHDCLNISVTTEYWAEDARRRLRVNMGNGTLRYRFGMTPHSRATSGVGFVAKSLLHSVMSRTGWLERVRSERKPIEFKLEKGASRLQA